MGGRGGVRGNAIAFAWCRAPLAADKHLWTSQAACNKQHGWCHRSPRGLEANWSATRSARPWVNVSRVENLETSPSQVSWIEVSHSSLTSSYRYPNWLCFFHQTWERTLRWSRRVRRWHWTRRCYCTAFPLRECHKLRWDTDTGDIYRRTSSMHLPFPHQKDKEQEAVQDQLLCISCCSAEGTDNPARINYTSNYSLLLIYYLSYISEKPYITSSRHITQDRLGGFTPRLASLKAYP